MLTKYHIYSFKILGYEVQVTIRITNVKKWNKIRKKLEKYWDDWDLYAKKYREETK